MKMTPLQDLKSLNIKQLTFLTAMLIIMVSLSLYWNDSLVGILAGITGVICVFLVNMRKLSNFLWGFINCALYGYVAYSASYFGDTMLNWGFYLPIQLIGYYMWSKSMEEGEVKSRSLNPITAVQITLITIFTVIVYSTLLQSLGGKLSFVDSSTTILSVAATFLMVKGYREQWLCWIAVNLLSIYMWVVNYQLEGSGAGVLIMWFMFLANSIYGCISWWKVSNKPENNLQ